MKRGGLEDFLLFLLRLFSGLILMQAGGSKLFGWFGIAGPPPAMMSQMWIGGWLEVVGGALIIAGLFTRPVAFILAGMMAVAYFQFHFPNGFWPAQNQGAPAVLLCFIFLYLVARGAGAMSLDHALLGRHREVEPAAT